MAAPRLAPIGTLASVTARPKPDVNPAVRPAPRRLMARRKNMAHLTRHGINSSAIRLFLMPAPLPGEPDFQFATSAPKGPTFMAGRSAPLEAASNRSSIAAGPAGGPAVGRRRSPARMAGGLIAGGGRTDGEGVG